MPNADRLLKTCINTGTPQTGIHVQVGDMDLTIDISALHHKNKITGAICSFIPRPQFEKSAKNLESYRNLDILFKTIFEASHDGINVFDDKGKLVHINRASERLNGVEGSSLLGKHYNEMIKMGVIDRSVVPEIFKTRKQASLMCKVKSNKTLLATGTPAFDETGDISFVVLNLRDMTELNQIMEALEYSRMEVEKYKTELSALSLPELTDMDIVAESESYRNTIQTAAKLAQMDVSEVLILGESGVGKGLMAKFIHKSSNRNQKPFIQINCAALPEQLLEAELFGYEKGAFTGASSKGKIGLFEAAHEGTIFLDEIGELPFSVQAKLLKYLDDQQVMRLGSVKYKQLDCMVLVATNRVLEDLVKEGKFRGDLYHRLNAFTICPPPLRERTEDIFEMTRRFLAKFNAEFNQKKRITEKGVEILLQHDFPGNVRELINVIKKAVVLSEEDTIDDIIQKTIELSEGVPPRVEDPRNISSTLTDALLNTEKTYLQTALNKCKSLESLSKEIGTSRTTAFRKMKKHGLSF
jgi:PAS domain S-box-containing protein